MFKALFEFLDGEANEPAEGSAPAKFIADLEHFAFYPELNEVAKKLYNADLDTLKADRRYKDIVAALLGKDGLNYGNLRRVFSNFTLIRKERAHRLKSTLWKAHRQQPTAKAS